MQLLQVAVALTTSQSAISPAVPPKITVFSVPVPRVKLDALKTLLMVKAFPRDFVEWPVVMRKPKQNRKGMNPCLNNCLKSKRKFRIILKSHHDFCLKAMLLLFYAKPGPKNGPKSVRRWNQNAEIKILKSKLSGVAEF